MATKTRRLADLLANIDDNSKVTSAGLLDATITAADLADDSVGAAEIIDDAVGAAAIADDAVGAAAIADDAVGAAAIADNAVGAAAIAANAVGESELSVDYTTVKPHIQPGTLYPAWSGLLDNHTGQTITDSSASARTISVVGEVNHSGVQKKIGSTSIKFDGSSDYLTVPDHADWVVGNGNWTIEFFVYFNATSIGNSNAAFFQQRASSGTGSPYQWRIFQDNATTFTLSGSVSNTSANFSWTPASKTWYHVALVRDGSNAKLFINGTQTGGNQTVSGTFPDVSDVLMIGRIDTSNFLDGYMDEIRIVKGKAVYTGNFAVPTALTTTGGTYSSATNVVNPTSSETKLLIHSEAGGHSGAYGTVQSDGKKYYYTDIKGSKPIKDPRIGGHFGSQRHRISSMQMLKGTETKDAYICDGREWCRAVRITGTSAMPFYNDANGQRFQLGNGSSHQSYLEIVGYFSDANMIGENYGSSVPVTTQIDGGARATKNPFSGSIADPKRGRYVNPNTVGNLALGATLGIHTLRINSNGNENQCSGFELIAQDNQDFTATNATNILTSAGHTLTNGDQIRLAGSDLPNGLNATTTYYVVGVSGNNFQVSASLGGAAVTFSDDGSGTRTFTALNNIQIPTQNVVSYGKKFSVSATAQHYNPFAFKTDGSTAWASGAHNGTSWPVGTGASANIDTATSLGLENWKHSNNYYKPYNGGRVVKWVDSSGNIKTSVTVMPPNARSMSGSATMANGNAKANASIANNTFYPTFEAGPIDQGLSEVAHQFNYREFGNGAANRGTNQTYADASMLSSTADDIAYCMDDGLTTLAADNCADSSNNRFMTWSSGDVPKQMTFMGSGITVMSGWNLSAIEDKYYNVALNLPYGTHILGMGMTNQYKCFVDGIELQGSNHPVNYWKEFVIHQPKRPPIPEDAVVLADYMLMADFVKQGAKSNNTEISKGVRVVNGSRDVSYNSSAGVNDTTQIDVACTPFGFSGARAGSATMTAKLHFFGTDVVAGIANSEQAHTVTFPGTTANAKTAVAAGFDVADIYTLADSAALGNNEVISTVLNGGYNFTHYQCGIPTHTSSHYQDFETRYANELVGGDRNMEQTNLVVTADGKTWDQVTRPDTSYIGNVVARMNTATSTTWANWVIFDDWRGHIEGKDCFLKNNFALNYNGLICLKDGWYSFNVAGEYSGHLEWYLNGLHVTLSSSSTFATFSHPIEVVRGDHLYLLGDYGSGSDVNRRYQDAFIIKLNPEL